MLNPKKFLIMNRDAMSNHISIITDPFALITITDPSSAFINIRAENNVFCRGILGLKFADVSQEDVQILPQVAKYRAITDAQAKSIAAFALSLADDVDIFAINCDAGICRSSAIAAALSDKFNGSSEHIWNDQRFLPNTTVYHAVRKVLFPDDYYEDEDEMGTELTAYPPLGY